MSIILTLESFITGTKQSTLVDDVALEEVVESAAAAGRPFETSTQLADALVERDLITRWQAEKLLQGKYRGFRLGRYQLRELLGKGEMSSVYLAEHVRMKRRCAIKVLPAHKVRETSYLGRFHREAEAVAQLDHPNIVRAYDVDVEEEGGAEIHYLVMEYVLGKSLEKKVLDDGPLGVIEAADMIRQAAAGVAHAHGAGLVHRDIKPGNLLIDTKGVVKLLDLGLARFFKDPDRESLTIKHDEKVLGTADYLAPEQAVDSHSVDERADIYAMGCTLFYALTGRPPFVEGTLVQRLLAHQTQVPPAISEFRDDCPENLTAIIRKMMAKEPGDRYQTAEAVVRALGEFLVENGDRAWRERNLETVAEIRGLDAVLNQSGPNKAKTVSSVDGDLKDSDTSESESNDSDSQDESSGSSISSSKAGSKKRRGKRKKKSGQSASARETAVENLQAIDRPKPIREPEPTQLPTSRPTFPPAVESQSVSPSQLSADQAADASVDVSYQSGSATQRVQTWWQRIDKQILAIVALLAISISFVASVAINARATDQPVEPINTPVDETVPMDQLSPILNDPNGTSPNDFGIEGVDAEPDEVGVTPSP